MSSAIFHLIPVKSSGTILLILWVEICISQDYSLDRALGSHPKSKLSSIIFMSCCCSS